MTTALTFPLSSDFVASLKIAQLSFYLRVRSEFSGTQGGDIIVKETREPLWYAKAQSDRLLNKDAFAAQASIDAMGESLQTFYAYNPAFSGPGADPNGAILASATVTLSAVDSTNRLATLAGLPVGYVLGVPDMLSFAYGTGGTSMALHRIVQGGAAAADGTLQVEVRPNIRVGWTSGAAVTLVKPTCEMRIVPGTFAVQSTDPTASQLSFEAVQVI